MPTHGLFVFRSVVVMAQGLRRRALEFTSLNYSNVQRITMAKLYESLIGPARIGLQIECFYHIVHTYLTSLTQHK
jgi:hypothetical protein